MSHHSPFQYLPEKCNSRSASGKPGPAKRVQFVSLKMVREGRSLLYPRRQVRCAGDAVELVRPLVEGCDREVFLVVVLDTKHFPNIIQVVSVGSLDATIVHPREIFKIAVIGNGSAVLCLHTHPSGDPAPSSEDLAVTKRLSDAAGILGIDLLDHVVVGSDGKFTSLRAEGHL